MHNSKAPSYFNGILPGFMWMNRSDLIKYGLLSIVTLMAFISYAVLPLYSIDYYFLYQLPDINSNIPSCNFYSIGRFAQSLLRIYSHCWICSHWQNLSARFFYCFNNPVFGGCGAAFAVKSGLIACLLLLIISTNLFYAELLHYSIIIAYGGLAILFMTAGFIFSEKIRGRRSPLLTVLSILFFVPDDLLDILPNGFCAIYGKICFLGGVPSPAFSPGRNWFSAQAYVVFNI